MKRDPELVERLIREAVEAADYGIGRDGCPFCANAGPPGGPYEPAIDGHRPNCIARLFGATGEDPAP